MPINGASTIDEVLSEFFVSTSPQHVHGMLHDMQDALELGRLAMLPRAELASRAALAADLKHAIGHLYTSLVDDWGDDPSRWPVPQCVREALGDVLSLHLATEPDHSAQSGVAPSGAGAMNARRRRARH